MGESCLVSVQRDCNLKDKRENWDGTDFKMGVAATLPELSEWTLRLRQVLFAVRAESSNLAKSQARPGDFITKAKKINSQSD